MIIKILSKIKIHFFFYVFAFLALITGFFKEFSIFTCIILIHEIGHIVGAILYKWKIDRIIILPFGGLTIFNEKLNRPIIEELVITLLGPIFQILFCSFWTSDLVQQYHYFLLIFNLLPIFPLDGSKLFNLLLCKFFSFKLSHKISLCCSFILFILMVFSMFFKFNLLFLLIMLLLLFKCFEEVKNHNVMFNRFLMERFLYKFDFKKEKVIKGINFKKFLRDYRHLFFVDNFYYSEREILRKRFDK